MNEKEKDVIDELLEQFGHNYEGDFWGHDTEVMPWKVARLVVIDFLAKREKKASHQAREDTIKEVRKDISGLRDEIGMMVARLKCLEIPIPKNEQENIEFVCDRLLKKWEELKTQKGGDKDG